MKSRIFRVIQNEKCSKTGEFLLTEDRIKVALMSHQTIKRWAYICRDRDVYSVLDKEQNPENKDGQIKPRYWVIVLESPTNALEMSVIAKWFGISEKCVEKVKGAGKFLACVEELTHEAKSQQQLGKRLYKDSEVHANFDFQAALGKNTKGRAKCDTDLKEDEKIRQRVLYEGLQLRQLRKENPLAYQKDCLTLGKFRYEYIVNHAEMPKTRINYYVCGRGGMGGKSLICKAIARSLYPNLKDDDDIFFEVGAKGVPFNGYDGQPVIIWNDRRSVDLLEEFGGRENIFKVFDTHPMKDRQNAPSVSVNVCNEVNIINGVLPYKEFLDGLVADYDEKTKKMVIVEDRSQSYRRFPMIISLREEDFDLLMNRGVYYGTKEYEQYIEYNNIRGSLETIEDFCGANTKLARELESKVVALVAEKHNELLGRVGKEQIDEGKVKAMFADVGQVGEVIGEGKYINGEFVTNEELVEIMKENAKRKAEESKYQAEIERQREFEKSIFSGIKLNETDNKLSEEVSLKEEFLDGLSKILKEKGRLDVRDEHGRPVRLTLTRLEKFYDSESHLGAIMIESGGQILELFENSEGNYQEEKNKLIDFVIKLPPRK